MQSASCPGSWGVCCYGTRRTHRTGTWCVMHAVLVEHVDVHTASTREIQYKIEWFTGKRYTCWLSDTICFGDCPRSLSSRCGERSWWATDDWRIVAVWRQQAAHTDINGARASALAHSHARSGGRRGGLHGAGRGVEGDGTQVRIK